jgi:putative transcriptional regulator
MRNLGEEIVEAMREAAGHARGEVTGARVTVIRVPNVRTIREKLDMSQSEFADAYEIPLATSQGWEQGRRHPDRIAAAYLKVIARLPAETRAALQM